MGEAPGTHRRAEAVGELRYLSIRLQEYVVALPARSLPPRGRVPWSPDELAMLRALATRYGVTWTPSALAKFSGAVGGGALVWWTLRYGFRELLKLIPMFGGVAAGALNAAAAFGITVGIGEAACVWLAYRRRGLAAPDQEVRRAFAEGLAAGIRYARNQAARRPGDRP